MKKTAKQIKAELLRLELKHGPFSFKRWPLEDSFLGMELKLQLVELEEKEKA